jgi:hypothetical protein
VESLQNSKSHIINWICLMKSFTSPKKIPLLLAAFSLCAQSAFAKEEQVLPTVLPTYGRYGNVTTKGANWLYRYNLDPSSPFLKDFRVTIVDGKSAVKMFKGKHKSTAYYRQGIQTLEEKGNIKDGAFLRENYIYETLYEYWSTGGSDTYLGSDTTKGSAKLSPVMGDRLDRGMVIPEKMVVGEIFQYNADFYEKGKFLGPVSYTIKLLDRKPIKVTAGRFEDCAHLSITIRAGSATQVADEWWVKNVGLARRVIAGNKYDSFELSAYNLKGDHLTVPGQFVFESSDAQLRIDYPNGSKLYDVDCGTAAAGSITPEKMVTIRNSGDAPLQFSTEVLTNANSLFRRSRNP